MKKFNEMMESVAKLQEIKGSTAGLVSTARNLFREEASKINQDRDLSPTGRMKKREALQKQYGEAFIKNARQLREDYDKAVVKASVAAEFLLNEGPAKPSPTAVASFEREFSALKTDLMLETRPAEAMRKLKAFAEAQNDAYLAKQVLNDFHSVVQSILDIAGPEKAKYKLDLQNTLTSVRDKSMTDEQKKAQEIHAGMANEFGRDIFLPNGIEFNAIQEAFGAEFARAANKPQYYVLEEEKTNEQG